MHQSAQPKIPRANHDPAGLEANIANHQSTSYSHIFSSPHHLTGQRRT